MSNMDYFVYHAAARVVNGNELRERIIHNFGFADTNNQPGSLSGGKSVLFEKEIDYGLSADEDMTELGYCILDTPDAVAMEKAIRTGNDDLAYDLAGNAFEEGFIDWISLNKPRIQQKINQLENYIKDEVANTEVEFSSVGAWETINIAELFNEDADTLIEVNLILGFDTSSIYTDRAQLAFDVVMNSLESRGLLEEPLEETDEEE